MTELPKTPNLNVRFQAPESEKQRRIREETERAIGTMSYKAAKATFLFQEPGQEQARSSDSEPSQEYITSTRSTIEQDQNLRTLHYSHPYQHTAEYPELEIPPTTELFQYGDD